MHQITLSLSLTLMMITCFIASAQSEETPDADKRAATVNPLDIQGVDRALERYTGEVQRARERLLQSLQRELQSVTRRGDLDSANALQAYVAHVESGGDPTQLPGGLAAGGSGSQAGGGGWQAVQPGLPLGPIDVYGPLPADTDLNLIMQGATRRNIMGMNPMTLSPNDHGR